MISLNTDKRTDRKQTKNRQKTDKNRRKTDKKQTENRQRADRKQTKIQKKQITVR